MARDGLYKFIDIVVRYAAELDAFVLLTGMAVAVAVMLSALWIGVPLGRLIARLPGALARFLDLILIVFMVAAPTMAGTSARFLLAAVIDPGKILPSGIPFHPACALGAFLVSCPITCLCAAHAFRHVDTEQVLAARTLGIRERDIYRKVTLPQAVSGIRAGAVLTFVRAFGEYTASVLVLGTLGGGTGTVPEILMSRLCHETYWFVCVWIVVLLLAAVVFLKIAHRYRRHHSPLHHM